MQWIHPVLDRVFNNLDKVFNILGRVFVDLYRHEHS